MFMHTWKLNFHAYFYDSIITNLLKTYLLYMKNNIIYLQLKLIFEI